MNYYNKLKKAVEELETNGSINLIAPAEVVINYLNTAIASEAKTYTTKSDKPRENVKASINSIFKNTSQNGHEYLLLKTDQKHPWKENDNIAIFCFKLNERWGELNEGGNYSFIVERGKNDSYILVDFIKNY